MLLKLLDIFLFKEVLIPNMQDPLKVKVKQSLYRLGMAQRVPGS